MAIRTTLSSLVAWTTVIWHVASLYPQDGSEQGFFEGLHHIALYYDGPCGADLHCDPKNAHLSHMTVVSTNVDRFL